MLETDGEVLILIGTILLFIFIISFIVFVAYQQKHNLKNEYEKKLLEQNYQFSLIESKIKTQENERKHIADELHDDLVPLLASAKVHLKVGMQKSINQEQFENNQIISEIIENSILKIRRLSHILDPVVLESFGLRHAISDLANKLNSSENILIALKLGAFKLKMNKFSELALFRIIQELIMNAYKHGEANKFSFYMLRVNNQIQIRISHNGNKFTDKEYENKLIDSEGIGLKNIQSRLKLLGGKIDYSYNNSLDYSEILLTIPYKS